MNEGNEGNEERNRELAPLLSVRNGARAGEFYRAKFMTEELFRIDSRMNSDSLPQPQM